MELKKVRSRRIYEQVADAIQEMIRSGNLKPGDQLISERQLAEQFGVSRASVRQALSALASRGIVTITPRGGAYVRAGTLADLVSPVATILLRSPEDVLHLIELRRMIEVESARLAAMRATEADLYRIRQASRDFQADVAAGRDANLSDSRFHLAICQATRNPFVAEVLRMFGRLLEEGYGPIRARLIKANDEYHWAERHCALLTAIENRAPDRAAALMAEYLDEVVRGVREAFAGEFDFPDTYPALIRGEEV